MSRSNLGGASVLCLAFAVLLGAVWRLCRVPGSAFVVPDSPHTSTSPSGGGETAAKFSNPTKWESQRRLDGIARRAVAAPPRPPTSTAPPDTDEKTETGEKSWLECLVQHEPDAGVDYSRAEVWMLRKKEFGYFRRLLYSRRFDPMAGSGELKCRERSVDSEARCAECMRFLHGGFYGFRGVSVPAYPPPANALGCLQLSKPLEQSEDDHASDMTSGSWDASPQYQAAFCNTINARIPRGE
eukprot:TRINITY_DN45375_c0_g1_i1.p1 TRINITY_DN45375_c0_g1~~TRINITY_DN45375_c0_g1_i1.p1  ORF type:complete len:241 (-),score=27.54 TRINITY_DN45375_c0_g1_i1:119-841(-)